MLRVGILRMFQRVPLFIGGFLIALPMWQTEVVGAVIVAVALLTRLVMRGRIQLSPNEG